MANKIYKVTTLFIIILTINLYFTLPVLSAQGLPEKHILILHPFTPEYPFHEQYNKGLKDKLEQSTGYKFHYSYEYLDFAHHSLDPVYFENIAQYLKVKYKDFKPDFIVTQANLLLLMEKYGKDIFPEVPVIIAQDRAGLPPVGGYFNYFFIQQSTETERNVQLILQLMPNIKKIYIAIGDSEDERIFVSRFAEVEKKYIKSVKFTYMNKMSYEQMLEAVKNAEKDSVILYFRWLSDVNGKRYIPEEVIKDICKASEVPVYGTDMQFLGSGIVGGYVREQQIAGQAAAETIFNILDYKILPGQRIQVVPNVSAFDWRQLKKWGISEKSLPIGSRVEYREFSVWEQYRGYIYTGIALMVIEALLIFGLSVNMRMRKKAEKKLLQINESLQIMTERLINLDKIKDEFLTNTSHELQTPLNGIINITQTLSDGNYGSVTQRQQEELQVVLAISRRLSSLIKDLIDVEKIKRNEIHLNLEAVDVKSALLLTVDVFRYLIQGKKIDILTFIPDDIPPIYADRNRLIQVMYNLLGNAVKFTERGTISISTKGENGSVKVLVEDTGIGISKEVQAQLFEAFAQGDRDIPVRYGGSGLGLYISQKLLERMGGKIRIEWSEPGKGTCLSISLPISQEIPQNSESEAAVCIEAEVDDEGYKSVKPKGFKILAVDDEPTNLRVLKSVLIGEGYVVLTASSGKEAIDLIKSRNDIDLVLMDVMMPEMSGYEACKKIREIYSLYDLPLLILTVRNSPEDITAGFEAGANDFVVKPFEVKELKARVATLLLMKKSVQEALENEMAFLQAQIKPHFLYNALSTIMSFCYTDGERAGELLMNLSEYLQKSFNIDDTTVTVSLENELELTRAYVEIEKARFGERLVVEMNIDESLLEHRILPLTIQPLVENAIRHGLMTKKSGGVVRIVVNKEKEKVKVSVEDNGIGIENIQNVFKGRESLNKHRGGVGLSNIRRRLMNFYGSELYLNSIKNEGTKIWFTIPD